MWAPVGNPGSSQVKPSVVNVGYSKQVRKLSIGNAGVILIDQI